MYKLKLKISPIPFVILVLGLLLTFGSLFISSPEIKTSAFLAIIGIFSVLLILNLLFYSRISILQTINLTITSTILWMITFATANTAFYAITKSLIIDSNFYLSINPITIAISSIFSLFVVKTLFVQENHIEISSNTKTDNNTVSEPEILNTQQLTTKVEIKNPAVETSVNNTDISKENKIQQLKSEIIKDKIEIKPVIQANTEPVVTGNNTLENRLEMPKENELILPELELEDLTDFQEIDNSQKEINHTFSAVTHDIKTDIPENIRLNENPTSRIKDDAKGKISAIGKLLVNARDIENIIEANALVQHIGQDENTPTRIIKATTGDKIKEKLNILTENNKNIKNITLIDSSGFILSSTINDNNKEQVIGAVISGAYQAINNYISQLGFQNPTEVIFETENSTDIVCRYKDKYLFSNLNIDQNIVKSKQIEEPLISEDKQNNTTRNYNYIICSEEGQLITSSGSDLSEIASAISAAIFENIKIFIKGIQPEALKRIVITNDSKALLIRKHQNKIILVLDISKSTLIQTDLLKDFSGIVE